MIQVTECGRMLEKGMTYIIPFEDLIYNTYINYLIKENIGNFNEVDDVGVTLIEFNSSYDFKYIISLYKKGLKITEICNEINLDKIMGNAFLTGGYKGKLETSNTDGIKLGKYKSEDIYDGDILVYEKSLGEVYHVFLNGQFDTHFQSKIFDGLRYKTFYEAVISLVYNTSNKQKYIDNVKRSNKSEKEINEKLEQLEMDYVQITRMAYVDFLDILNYIQTN